MKKVIALPLLLLANLVILAHAIVPHHHHDKIVVSICDFLSIEDALEHTHSDHHHGQEKGHEHTGHDLGEECLLNELYIRASSNQNLSASHSGDFDLSNSHLDFPLYFCEFNQQIDLTDYGELPFRQKPYVYSYHTYYITHSLGLRAPPVC